MRRLFLLVLACAVSACSAAPPPCAPPATSGVRVYLVDSGWHTEIGIPVEELDAPLAFYRGIFPGAHAVMFGYGKKTFITAPAETFSEYLLGPVPGPAVIQVMGLNVSPDDAYPGDTIVLALPPGGRQALLDYIGNDLARDDAGHPEIVTRGSDPDSLFYRARSGYDLMHTCNAWVAEALQAAGVPLSGNGVVFSGQVMSRGEEAAARQCAAP